MKKTTGMGLFIIISKGKEHGTKITKLMHEIGEEIFSSISDRLKKFHSLLSNQMYQLVLSVWLRLSGISLDRQSLGFMNMP